MERTSNTFYILPEGSTREQEISREDLEASIKSGSLSLKSFVFIPECKQWKKIEDVEEFKELGSCQEPGSGLSEGESEDQDRLREEETEYEEVLKELHEDPKSFELLSKAARLAASLGKKDEAAGHYQRALELRPFHPRIAREIKRSFALSEQKSFSLLERKAPWWEDFLFAASRAYGGDWKIFGAVAGVLTLVLFIPGGIFIFLALCLLLEIHVVKKHDSRVFSFTKESLTEILTSLKAFVTSVAVWFECLVPFLAAALIFSLANRSGQWNPFSYIERSPLMVVWVYMLSLAYMPAVWILSVRESRLSPALLNPRTIIPVIKSMEGEYLITCALIGVASLLWIMLSSLLGRIPVLGKVINATLAVYFVWLMGFALGRLLSRYKYFLPGASA